MKYQPFLFENNKDSDQYIILNDDNSNFNVNLKDNEVIIRQLSAAHCPADRICIGYKEKYKASVLCKHFINLFQISEKVFSPDSLFCDRTKRYCEVKTLMPVKCPAGKNNCLKCKKLVNIIAIPYPEKSNCHVVCDEMML